MARKVQAETVKNKAKKVAKEQESKVNEKVKDITDSAKDMIDDLEVEEKARGIWSWIKKNWSILVGVVLTAIALYLLKELILGIVILVLGILFLAGVFGGDDS